jgi:hypothetical protein
MSGGDASHVVNREVSEQLFDLLNTSRRDEPTKFAKLYDELTPVQQEAHDAIREMLDLDASMLGIADNPDRFIDGYIHHVFDRSWEGRAEHMPEFRHMSKDGRIFFRALLERQGREGFVPDAAVALDLYSRGIGRKLHLEPALEKVLSRAKYISQRDKNPFVWYYTQMAVDAVKGRPSAIGQHVDRLLMGVGNKLGYNYQPGDAGRATMAVGSAIYGALLGGNRRYPIMAMATSLSTTGARYGTFRTIKGLMASATPEGQAIFKMTGLDQQWNEIFSTVGGANADGIINKLSRAGERMSRIRPAAPSVQDSEAMIRGMTMWAHIDHVLNNLGKQNLADLPLMQQRQVVAESVRASEEINHIFGPLGRPPGFTRASRSMTALGTQFLSFGPKQTETLAQIAAENPGNILRFMMLSGYIARVASEDLGVNVRDYVGVGYTGDMLSPRNITSPGVEALVAGAVWSGELLKVIQGSGNPATMDQAFQDLLTKLEKVQIGRAVITQGIHSAEQATGEVRDPMTQELLDPSVQLEAGRRGERSEWVSILTGLESENARRERMAREEVYSLKQKVAWEGVKLMRRVEEAAVEGDWEQVELQMARLGQLGIPREEITSKLEAQYQAMNFGQLAREMIANPKLMHEIIDIMDNYRMEFE